MIKRLLQKIKSRARQGKAFETMIRTALKHLAKNPENKLWFQRIWDYRSFIYLNPRFRAIKQPADFMGAVNGRLFMIECKSSQANRFDIRNIRTHQLEAMEELYTKGADYWIVILKRGKTRQEQRMFAFDYNAMSRLAEAIYTCGYKTADWNIVARCATMEIFREKRRWNLKPLLRLRNGA